MPANPTWQQVADIAAKVDGAAAGHERHLPARPGRLGRDLRPADHRRQHLRRHLVRPRTGTPRSTARPFKQATKFYVNLVRTHGEAGAPQAGFTECLNDLEQGKVAMWYDATSAAGIARGSRLPGAGQDRLRPGAGGRRPPAPAGSTPGRGASSRRVEEGQRLEVHLLGLEQGLRGARRAPSSAGHGCRPASVPRPTRTRTYLQQAVGVRRTDHAAPSRAPTRATPGVQPRPALGIQFVDIPEFTDLGTQVSPGGQLRDRRPDHRRRRRWTAGSSSPTTWPSATAPGSRR